MTDTTKPQVTKPSCREPRPPGDGDAASSPTQQLPRGRWPLPTRQAVSGTGLTCSPPGGVGARPYHRRPRRPCHQRAIHNSLDRPPADTHGQHHGGRNLRRSPSPEAAILLGLALQAGGQAVIQEEDPNPNGPRWVRMTPATPGSRRARAVTRGRLNPQVSAYSWRRPARAEESDRGFEPLSLRQFRC